MAEIATTEPVVEVKVEAPVVEAPKQDLFKRVAEFKAPEPTKAPANEFGITEDDYKRVESDPSLSKLYKSLQAGAGKKFEEAASIRKEIEKLKSDNSAWSKERVKSLLNDPNFVNAAQQVALEQAPPNSGLTDQAWSALSESDKG
jgi:hypothetical protein